MPHTLRPPSTHSSPPHSSVTDVFGEALFLQSHSLHHRTTEEESEQPVVPAINTSILNGRGDGPENGQTEDCPASAFGDVSERYCWPRREKLEAGHLPQSDRSLCVNETNGQLSIKTPLSQELTV